MVAYRSYQELIDDCDRECATRNARLPIRCKKLGTKRVGEASTDGALKSELRRVFGIDLTANPRLRTGVAETSFGKIGQTSPSSAASRPLLRGWGHAETTTLAAAR